MFVSKIQIQNFKTFNDISIDLNDFNVLIGACASGKTNLVEVFEFLKDISQNFRNAIKKHGGEYLRNFNLLDENDISCLEITFKNKNGDYSVDLNGSIGLEEEIIKLTFNQVDYDISFRLGSDSCEVLKEHVSLRCEIIRQNELFENIIHIDNSNGVISAGFEDDVDFLKISDIIPTNLCDMVENNFKKENIPLINSSLSSIPINWGGLFGNISAYDFDSKFLKNLNEISNETTLNKFGANLPVVLNKILKDESKRKDFILFLTNILPYIKDVFVEKILDEDRIFMIQEKYNDVKIPGPFVSDGTSTIIALIIVLYFQKDNIVIIEEPERHIHPSLLGKLLLLIKSVRDKQIILTTHNPELLKHVELEDIYFISRDSSGFSKIMQLIENQNVKPFIEELGVDNVFVNDYLGLNYD